MERIPYTRDERLTRAQKNRNDKQWYKDHADRLDRSSNELVNYGFGGISEKERMQVNYDLFNNTLNLEDFEYVCKPYGSNIGELPASMVNRDIISGKIKVLMGMVMARPMTWKPLAVNREATTARETEESNMIRQYVINQIMAPIRQQIIQKQQEQIQGKELSEEEVAQIQQQVEQEAQAMTPPEVKKYMQRDYQAPAEIMSEQLLKYLIQKVRFKDKIENTVKHTLLSAYGINYIGIMNGEPVMWNVNPIRFSCDLTPDTEFIEDCDSASYEYLMSPSQVIKYFGDDLTEKEIDAIYEMIPLSGSGSDEDLFEIIDTDINTNNSGFVRVVHTVWKSLRRIGFLTYIDENDQEQERRVDEDYVLNEDAGDVRIEWEWIPECYETWKIRTTDPIYKRMRPIPGQFKDTDNMYECKLPYYGIVTDNMNSQPVSLMDRLKPYQYFYDIIMYRLELILASDKGKKILMNIKAIPTSSGIDMKTWQYFFESTPFMYFDPGEEGNQYADTNAIAKTFDLSMVSDIQKYIEIAEYLRKQAGKSVGITDTVEGQIGAREAVRNTQQTLQQTSLILEPYFNLIARHERNVLEALLEAGKVAYAGSDKLKLPYIMDDVSIGVMNIDMGVLDASTVGIFIADGAKAEEAKEVIRQTAQAALQNQRVELSDVISMIRQDGIAEAEESLKVAEQNRRDAEMAMQQQSQQAQSEEAERQRMREREKHEEDKEIIVLKEEERRKTEIIKAGILGASFNPNQDKDKDGINDFIEIAKHGLDADIKQSKQQLEREKFEHQKEVDKTKAKQTDEKLSIERQKAKAAGVSKVNK